MDPDEQLFGVPRLREVLEGVTTSELEEIQKTVLESVENFARGARQADDLTLLLVRYRDPNAADNTDTSIPPPASSEAA
jgi:serine phosphatase RsbU (regulator of sigma subunit)